MFLCMTGTPQKRISFPHKKYFEEKDII